MSAQDLPVDVSRETSDRLKTYESLLQTWNPRINLVSRSTLSEAWTRHIVDSVQIFDLAPGFTHWADLGSGGGFPGLVCAILAAERVPDAEFTLVESDQRKCAFLRSVARETGVKVQVKASRIEALPPLGADLLSARALADLPALLTHAERHLSPAGTAIFPKGRQWEKEVEAARKTWQFDLETSKSITDEQAVILQIKGVSRV
ncbi:16S rRNA (guanine(527)-N(7))-methyltransferase RsmG [Aquicoccus sp. SCR17]|nr:16S rRNA (guanine(527)-N(7))-methyltransferase RsmG [Carideicomes alvinocaridis]